MAEYNCFMKHTVKCLISFVIYVLAMHEASASSLNITFKGNDIEDGAQVDLAILRKDKTVNLCEMKFCETPYTLDKDEDMKLKARLKSFREALKLPSYSIQLTLVSSFGLSKGKYFSTFQNEVTLDDLFR